jgi:hypothetical protein
MDDQGTDSERGESVSDDYLMSFVTDATGAYVAVHLDLQGVKNLIRELEGIKRQLELNDCPHSHLFSCAGPPDGLTGTKIASQENEVNIVHHVKIYGWNEEWAERHGLKPRKNNFPTT